MQENKLRRGVVWALGGAMVLGAGCRSAEQYRQEADDVAYDIVRQTQQSTLNKSESFTIERPSDAFRRRLMEDQQLSYASPASLGIDELDPVEHWPDPNYGNNAPSGQSPVELVGGQPVLISLTQALQLGARNSFAYQAQKESVFRAALALDLERDAFRNTFLGQLQSQVDSDTTGSSAISGTTQSGEASASRTLSNGAELTGALAIDLANLWTSGSSQTLGISADTSISIPLLRGAGRHIVTEDLTQAQRDVVYAIYTFERYKRSFAVSIASSYLSVLSTMDAVTNAEQSYRSSVSSARRSRRLSDAGRLSSIQLDQAVQSELSARNRWISAQESYKESLDSFKNLLSLPPDARIELDRNELERMREPVAARFGGLDSTQDAWDLGEVPPADAEIVLEPPSDEEAGPLEIAEDRAVTLAFGHRLDLRISEGEVVDAQRKVVVYADRLRGELTLLGRAQFPADDDSSMSLSRADLSALLTLDLPIERTAERNAYRNRLIALEQAVRDLQSLEDDIKLSIRSQLRTLLESRESLKIQGQAVIVAEKRVASSTLLFEAGRAEIRDLLEAQDDLLSAQNSLTSALVNYRLAELELQRDLGVLNVDENGLWQEYVPEESERVES